MCSSRCSTIRPSTKRCLPAAGKKKPPGEILEEVARRKLLLKSYRVKRSLAFHPRAPRLITLRLLRDLYLMDLVQVCDFARWFPRAEAQALKINCSRACRNFRSAEKKSL